MTAVFLPNAPSARQKALGKAAFADQFFSECSLPSANRPLPKNLSPVVILVNKLLVMIFLKKKSHDTKFGYQKPRTCLNCSIINHEKNLLNLVVNS
jgi:hypothetical protein